MGGTFDCCGHIDEVRLQLFLKKNGNSAFEFDLIMGNKYKNYQKEEGRRAKTWCQKVKNSCSSALQTQYF